MRVTLVGSGITLPSVGESARRYNLANAYLEASLLRRAPEVSVTRIDAPLRLDDPHHDDELTGKVVRSEPDLIGLSCFCWDLEANLALAARARAELPAARVVLGGPSASFQAEALVAENSAVDAVVCGEGEVALAEIVARGLDGLSGVAGVTWRSTSGDVVSEPDRPPVPDLGGIDSPLLSGVLEPPRQNLMLELSRGCRYKCTYCAWKIFGGGVRYAPEERVRDELSWARQRGYEHAFVIDSAINDDEARLEQLCRAAREADPNKELALSYFANASFVTEGQVRLLDAIRAHEITVGLESVNPEALRAAGRKPVDLDRFAEATLLLSRLAPPTVSLMLGMPGDDLDGFRRTLDFVANLAERSGGKTIRSARVHWMLIAPGSFLWRRADRYGLDIASPGIPYVLGSERFPKADLVRAVEILHDHPRADLFVWEDAEPLALLDPGLPAMFAAGGDHIGGRAGTRISEDEVLRAIHPLVPGRTIGGNVSVSPLESTDGFPVIVLEKGSGQSLRLQVRPRGAERRPVARTRSFDLVCLVPEDAPPSSRPDDVLLGLLLEVFKRNDG